MGKVHPTAIIHDGAEVASDCEIGPYCIVGPKVKIASGNRLMSHVVLEGRTTIGSGNVFFPFAVIGGVPQDLKYEGEDAELVIGKDNTIRESVTINIGTKGGGGVTRVGDSNLIMAYAHLGHDVQVHNHTVIANACQIARHVIVEDYAIIGGLSGVSQFVRIGAHVYIGGFSGVERDVAPFCLGRGPVGAFEVWGMNLVGLKRRGFSSGELAVLQDINKIFFKDKSLEKETALQKIESSFPDSALAKQFVDFARKSEKGMHR